MSDLQSYWSRFGYSHHVRARNKRRSLIGLGHVKAGKPGISRLVIAMVWLGTPIEVFLMFVIIYRKFAVVWKTF